MNINNNDSALAGITVIVTSLLLLSSGYVYAFHENLPDIDTDAKIKKYFKEHNKSDQTFKDKVNKEELQAAFTNFACGINMVSDTEYSGSEFIGSALANCDKKMPVLKAECMAHADVFDFCGDTLDTYFDYKSLGGKAYDIMTVASLNDQSIMETNLEPKSTVDTLSTFESQEIAEDTDTSESNLFGSYSIDSLKPK